MSQNFDQRMRIRSPAATMIDKTYNENYVANLLERSRSRGCREEVELASRLIDLQNKRNQVNTTSHLSYCNTHGVSGLPTPLRCGSVTSHNNTPYHGGLLNQSLLPDAAACYNASALINQNNAVMEGIFSKRAGSQNVRQLSRRRERENHEKQRKLKKKYKRLKQESSRV